MLFSLGPKELPFLFRADFPEPELKIANRGATVDDTCYNQCHCHDADYQEPSYQLGKEKDGLTVVLHGHM